jgi:glycosyltransferase involved in cell wall biosynthesis
MLAYNRRNYVGKAIESVLNQRYADFELIIVDDASTDGTSEIIDRHARQDHRVRVVHHAENKGVGFARKAVVELARNDLVALMDDDDIMLPGRLDLQVGFMNAHPDVSVMSSWAYLIDGAGKIIGKSCPEVDLERAKAESNPRLCLGLIHPAVMFRKADVMKVGGYREGLRCLEDRDLWARMVAAGCKLAAQPEFVLHHRLHGESIMVTRMAEIHDFGGFIDFNLVRRLRGQDEMTREQYNDYLGSLPLLKRLSNKKDRLCQIAFWRATMHYSARAWMRFVGNLALALGLEPLATIRRILKKLPS